ncbi:unnamed protein product (macronuclear) [Paramecium tetraurelia]|uniref:Transmembrane protein n=1 Tax=Paramecium tetraurelia TaxID=5888 RepID=A0BNN5_PARTE|nr:uncharacterized protein GSPATT00030791001 [Paramecium tetraurelia]CAK60152.1 unnamed protein product [Paramecium tetraurelia]|eukprot:XP_001427550.1 hypothetical protein (macronuclear) [Paramecium tetraurelia strain d4-2]
MKARKYFVLVQENMQTSFYKTEKYTQINLDKNPNQKKFFFYDENQAKRFASNVQSCQNKEAFEKLEMDYEISKKLMKYEEKIKSCKTFSDNENQDGISINLRRLTYIYVLWNKNSYDLPRMYFTQITAQKNSTSEDQLGKFQDPKSALSYIREILETIEMKRKLIANTDTPTSQDNNKTEAELEKEESQLNFSNLGKLQQLDQQYSYFFPKFYIEKYPAINNINPEESYAIQCSSFCTLHFHSSIGINLINYVSGKSLKSLGLYVGHQKPYILGLLTVLYGLRYSLFLNLPSIKLQVWKQQDFEFLNKMVQPPYPQQQQAMAAIDGYSKLLRQVKFELVDQDQCKPSYVQAVKEFEKYAYVKQRSKKFRKTDKGD